jgi:hypothetical protein
MASNAGGTYQMHVGASSRDLRLSAMLDVAANPIRGIP